MTETINVGGVIKTVQKVDPIAFSKITKPFSALFFEMLPQETSRKFRLFTLDATSTPRIHAHTLDDRSYVHQANQIGSPTLPPIKSEKSRGRPLGMCFPKRERKKVVKKDKKVRKAA